MALRRGHRTQCSWRQQESEARQGYRVPLPQQQQKEHRLWVAFHVQISGLLLSQWTGDLSGSQAVSLEGSEGAEGKGLLLCDVFYGHMSMCVWAFEGQLWLRD